MRDVKLDPVTHDLVVVEGRLQVVDDYDRILQAVKIRKETQRGQWAFDTDAGLPYRDQILTRPFDPQLTAGELALEYRKVEGVTDVIDLVVEDPGPAREVTTRGTLATIYGPIPIGL